MADIVLLVQIASQIRKLSDYQNQLTCSKPGAGTLWLLARWLSYLDGIIYWLKNEFRVQLLSTYTYEVLVSLFVVVLLAQYYFMRIFPDEI